MNHHVDARPDQRRDLRRAPGPAVRDGRGRLSAAGPLHFPIAMTIAAAKAVLIVLFFMHVYYSHHLTSIVSVASFLWLGILLAFTLSDYLSRGWLDIPGK